jgi:hypothetical protein
LPVACLLSACSASGSIQSANLTPATPSFVFNPFDQSPRKREHLIAVVGPRTTGTLWQREVFDTDMLDPDERYRSRKALVEMLEASRTDLERTLSARGLVTLGPFESIDEMTDAQRASAFAVLEPVFDTNLEFAGHLTPGAFGEQRTDGKVTTRGTVTLAYFDPLSRERVWGKRLELPAISEPYVVSKHFASNGRLLSYSSNQSDAVVRALNKFYTAAMEKIYSQIDAREITALQRDVDQLKSKKRF